MNTKKIIVLILLPFVVAGVVFIYNKNKTYEIYATDPLIVTYNGGPPPNPMFVVTNMLPGDEVQKDFNVKNDSPNTFDVEMLAIKTYEEKDFASVLDIEIEEIATSNSVFIGKLQEFFDHSPFNLGNFASGSDKSPRVKVSFPSSAGNEYQNARVIFNIYWRTQLPPIELPPECEHLRGRIVNLIEGTNSNDRIFGTSKGDLILRKAEMTKSKHLETLIA